MFRPRKFGTEPNKSPKFLYLCQGLNSISVLGAHLLDQTHIKPGDYEIQRCYIQRPLIGPDCVLTCDSTAKWDEHLLGRKRTLLQWVFLVFFFLFGGVKGFGGVLFLQRFFYSYG